jgi:imidazolonepropionase-like amidohydrolase
MGRELMKPRDISTAKNPDLRAALPALKRAALIARQTAIQTNTHLVIVRDGKICRISADELRREDAERQDAE